MCLDTVGLSAMRLITVNMFFVALVGLHTLDITVDLVCLPAVGHVMDLKVLSAIDLVG